MKTISKISLSGIKTLIKRGVGRASRGKVRRSLSWTDEEVAHYQQERLRKLLDHAVRFVPYYRERNKVYRRPLCVSDADFWRAYKDIPVIEKAELRRFNSEFLSRRPGRLVTCHTTSGTTGSPVKLYASLAERSLSYEILATYQGLIAGARRLSTLFLSGFATPDKEGTLFWQNPFTKESYLSIYQMSGARAQELREALQGRTFDVVYGYASAVNELAKLVEAGQVEVMGVRAVMTTSEVLPPDWRDRIGKAFNANVFNVYGSQEGSHLFLDRGDGVLVRHPLVGLLEPMDSGLGTTEVLASGLIRKSFPLFRYRLGDEVAINKLDNLTGSISEISEVYGRSEDMVIKRDGSRVGYLCFHLTKNLEGIEEAQLVQDGYEKFTFRIVSDIAVRERNEKLICLDLNARMGASCDLVFEYVDRISRGSRGKFKAVVVNPQWVKDEAMEALV